MAITKVIQRTSGFKIRTARRNSKTISNDQILNILNKEFSRFEILKIRILVSDFGIRILKLHTLWPGYPRLGSLPPKEGH